MSRPRVVLILSCNYSGSHLLCQMLGAHSACADIGELRNLPKFAASRGPNVSGTEHSYLDDPLFHDFDRLPLARWHDVLLSRIRAEDPAANVLVDNSKRLDWAAQLVARADLDVRCIHLLRDPRALARRWQKTFAEPRQKRRIRLREAKRQWRCALAVLRAREPELYAWRWLRENAAITHFLQRYRVEAPVLSYEELLRAPERTLQQLMRELDLPFEAQQLEYWRARQYGTRKTQWLADRPADPFRLDLRWQQALSPEDAAGVIGRSELRDYAAARGYRFGRDGLEALQQPDHSTLFPGSEAN